MDMPLIEGEKVLLRGQEYIMPTLGGKAYRIGKAFEKLAKVEDVLATQQKTGKLLITSEIAGDMYDLVILAFQRNYPSISPDLIEDSIDMDRLMELFPLLVSQNKEKTAKGLKEVAEKNAQEQSTQTA